MSIRTGFEGYCEACGAVFRKTLALGIDTDELVGIRPASAKATFAKMTPKLQFGVELFGYDRFFANPSRRNRAWQLKGTNKGTKNRFKVFQSHWIADERLAALPQESLPSQAVANCVNAMMAEETSLLWHAFVTHRYGFANDFSILVVPAIEEGFRAENYPAIQIASFRAQVDDWMNRLTSKSASLAPAELKLLFEQFLTTLVSALVYGPEYEQVGAATVWEDAFSLEIPEPLGRQIMLTQPFTPDGRFLGKAERYGSSDVIFLGRSGTLKEYQDKLLSFVAEDGEDESILESKTLHVFHIAEEHGQVSHVHGVVFCEDDAWRYLDFSKYGTRLVGTSKDGNTGASQFHNAYRELEAGSVLFLGARESDHDELRLFRKAAAIKLSFFLDEDNVVLNM